MPTSTRAVLGNTFRDFLRSWRILGRTDLAWKLVAFALLTPAIGLLLRWLRSGAQGGVVADADILRFFVTRPAGVATLIGGGSLLAAITALEITCLMAIGRGDAATVRRAIRFGAARAVRVLRLTAHIVVRLLGLAVPFLLGVGLVYLELLHQHDINYYLAQHPSQFWVAAGLAALLLACLAVLLLRAIARWAFALPLVLFENVSPRRALGESARRSRGHRAVVLATLASWAVFGLALSAATQWLLVSFGRALAPRLVGSLTLLLSFVAVLVVVWLVVALAVGIVNVSLFALLLLRLYERIGEPGAAARITEGSQSGRLSRRERAGVAVVLLLASVGLGLLVLLHGRDRRPVLVIAHRGSSATAPENTLAAFRLAAEQGTDFIELDVQESSDGEVVVVHDSDLMKIGGAPLKIWESTGAALRAVDIGSHSGPQFSGERVPTLAEVFAAVKGRCRVVVELKSYGHDQQLEQRVVDVVEGAGMEHDCIFMSLDRNMVRKMKQLRPGWRCGTLVAKSMGDLTALGSDFLAVEARMATRRFVRHAHRAGQDVYVWTVDDPAWMLTTLSRGVDGLITNKPDLARRVLARRDQLSDAQRLLLALLVRLGASTEALESSSALRP